MFGTVLLARSELLSYPDIDIEFLKQLVTEAGEAAIQRADGVTFELKADASLVTEIDRNTELNIRARLDEKYPGFAFQGEEFGRHGADDVPLWAVDPIDGTTNMVFGIPFWCVSVGLIVEGVPVAGALYMPRTRELYWATRGGGAFRNGEPLKAVDRTTFAAEDTLGCTSGAIKALDVNDLPGRIRCLGSIAAEVVYASRGALCCHCGCYEGANDLAAAMCIATEAGCVARYIADGSPVLMADMVREGKTRAAFAVGTPTTLDLLCSLVRPRA